MKAASASVATNSDLSTQRPDFYVSTNPALCRGATSSASYFLTRCGAPLSYFSRKVELATGVSHGGVTPTTELDLAGGLGDSSKSSLELIGDEHDLQTPHISQISQRSKQLGVEDSHLKPSDSLVEVDLC